MLRVTDVFSLGGNWVVFFIQPHRENGGSGGRQLEVLLTKSYFSCFLN